MRFQAFLGKALHDIEEADLQRLVEEEVVEGLFMEYKSAFTSKGVARAVASFGNSESGGTLVIGMEADKLVPTGLVGLTDAGDLEESVVSTVRSSIAPIPPFTPRAVPLATGLSALVVEVAPGKQPPYILMRTGQVLVRTPTSSDPVSVNDRDSLDRLYRRGARGERWAAEQVQSVVRETDQAIVQLWTIPAVENGLAVESRIFTESCFEALRDLMPRHASSGSTVEDPILQRTQRGVTLLKPVFDAVAAVAVGLTLNQQGVIETWWERASYAGLDSFLEETMFVHERAMSDVLGHLGTVALVLHVNLAFGVGEDVPLRTLEVVRGPGDLDMTLGPSTRASMMRELERALGHGEWEPE